jgi:orotate phosphoribosyltransferase
MQKNKKIAKILLDIGCVNINFRKPFTLTSGKLSPVYVDCRKLISFPKEREIIINEMIKQIQLKYKKNIYVAGGETAGIPYAALISQKIQQPMIYIRKQPKGFGKGKLIEGEFKKNTTSVLIEDMATDAGSKLHFVKSLRANKLIIKDIFVAFFYGVYKNADSNLKKMNVNLNYLVTWHDIVSVSHNYLSQKDQKKLEDYISSIN